MQLDLFKHAPVYYHEALLRLGRLDFEGCREFLARHRTHLWEGPDPEPVERAVAWLETRVPGEGVAPERLGAEVLVLCLALRTGLGSVSEVLQAGGQPALRVVETLVPRALDAMVAVGADAADPVTPGLPWGVFHLFARDPVVARRALLVFLAVRGPSAAGFLALAEACATLGRSDEAECAWREGYGLDPAGAGWAPSPAWIDEVQSRFADDPLFEGGWWAVGAYLEGHFPRYVRVEPEVVDLRWRRFVAQTDASPPAVRFFTGLLLSELGSQLPIDDLTYVRRTLRDLHCDAYDLHRERLDELGPLGTAQGRGSFMG